jgi:sulfatase maturation enzyme AslB (radical SAM superfamily)
VGIAAITAKSIFGSTVAASFLRISLALYQGRYWKMCCGILSKNARCLTDGWNPMPFREFVVKVRSRCDLSCDYCYMYELADQFWRAKPNRMPAEIAESTVRRIGEQA